jgi:hypothetical protein
MYVGSVAKDDWQVTVRTADGEVPLTHHVKHSPDGFAWGYNGSAPTELARCLLIDATGVEDPDPYLVLRYRRLVISVLDRSQGFELSQHSVLTWWRNNAEPEE